MGGGETGESPEAQSWEDWDEDQRRALGQSHRRVLGSLEGDSSGGIGTRRTSFSARSPTSASVPQSQIILPSDEELNLQAQMAKQRAKSEAFLLEKEASGKKKKKQQQASSSNDKRFCTPRCILWTTVGILVIAGVVCVAIFLPNHRGEAPTVVSGFAPATETETATEPPSPSMAASIFRSMKQLMSPKSRNRVEDKILFPDFALASSVKGDGNWMPPSYDGLYSHVESPLMNAQPILWVTPRSGTRTLMDILTYCGKLVLASDMAQGHESASTLEIFSTPDNAGHYVNVDPTTVEGLYRAQTLGLVESELIHVIATPRIAEAASILFPNRVRTGRVFGLIRSPVEQALSEFRRLKELPHDDPHRLAEETTIAQFVESPNLYTNGLTKALANITDDTTITDAHVMVAKKVLYERILVGLTEVYEESVARFFEYFGWHQAAAEPELCMSNFKAARDHRLDHIVLPSHSPEYRTLADRNWADVEVYAFAKKLYHRQHKIVSVVA